MRCENAGKEEGNPEDHNVELRGDNSSVHTMGTEEDISRNTEEGEGMEGLKCLPKRWIIKERFLFRPQASNSPTALAKEAGISSIEAGISSIEASIRICEQNVEHSVKGKRGKSEIRDGSNMEGTGFQEAVPPLLQVKGHPGDTVATEEASPRLEEPSKLVTASRIKLADAILRGSTLEREINDMKMNLGRFSLSECVREGEAEVHRLDLGLDAHAYGYGHGNAYGHGDGYPHGPGLLKKVLILDLDNTLIECYTPSGQKHPASDSVHSDQHNEHNEHNEYNTHNSHIYHTKNHEFHFQLRPFCIQFLKHMAKYFILVLSTAADYKYTSLVAQKLQQLAGQRLFIQHYSYHSLSYSNSMGARVKKLLASVPLSHQIVLDDTFSYWSHCPQNYLPISPYLGDRTDKALISLGAYLFELIAVPDVRVVNHTCFRVLNKMGSD